MSFTIDKQTLDDLHIFSKGNHPSVYSLFNQTFTRGGSEILEQFFRYPLSEVAAITQRTALIRFFKENRELGFPFKSECFDTIEQYLSENDARSRLKPDDNTLQRKLQGVLGNDTAFQQVQKGVLAVMEVLIALNKWLSVLQNVKGMEVYREEATEMERLLHHPGLAELIPEKQKKSVSWEETTRLDELARFAHTDMIRKLLYHIYCLDVYVSVAAFATQHRFNFATPVPAEANCIHLKEVYHPLVKSAIPNSVSVTADNHIVFLTGANMAGKSTIMKTIGIAVYLAHVGFPVPAEEMTFSVRDGMITTINLPDNLNSGYSHFYAEVLRVKKVAEELRSGKNLFVMFDEMFRGTNVKDAYDATLSLSVAFDKRVKSIFIISTHITEAGEVLQQRNTRICFRYMPTLMNGSTPVYTYKIAEGISEDRHGMVIIQNERILDILQKTEAASDEFYYR